MKRLYNEDLQTYMVRFEAIEWKLKSSGIVLQSLAVGIHLLDTAGLQGNLKQLVCAKINLEDEDHLYENVLKAIRDIKEDDNTRKENNSLFNWKN